MKHIPGVDMSTGSLGQGISAAVGMALAGRLKKADWRVYAILGDGELEEGQVGKPRCLRRITSWTSFIAVVDNNGLQIDGRV